jgi:hypothetical protein
MQICRYFVRQYLSEGKRYAAWCRIALLYHRSGLRYQESRRLAARGAKLATFAPKRTQPLTLSRSSKYNRECGCRFTGHPGSALQCTSPTRLERKLFR